MKRCFLIILIFLIYSLVLSQEYEVSITTTTVWVKASDKTGRPVEGLTAGEFEVYEDGKKMATTCFDEIGSSRKLIGSEVQESPQTQFGSSATTATRVEASRRRLVLFVDLFNTSMAEYQRVRKMTKDFLDQVNEKSWDVMLGATINTGRAGVIVPFGNDLKRISQQLPLLKPNAQRDITVTNRKRQIAQILQTDPSKIEQAYRLAGDFARLEKIDSEKSIQSFSQLAEFLQKTVGEEHVIIVYISGGINLQPGRPYYEIVNKYVELSALNLNSPEFALTFPTSIREPNFDIGRQIKRSIGLLNKKNITVYSMNARGSANPSDDNIHEQSSLYIVNDPSFLKDYQESLDQIADETGGISFRNSNNFAKGFTDILQDSDHQYILCYKPPEHKEKGKYHEIKVVSLKSGVNLRFRKGYLD